MQIIPVIDICGGKVVHASGGDRKHYPSLKSVLTQRNEPVNVIADLLTFYQFNAIYIADLDAIFYQQSNIAVYEKLVSAFPEVTFWIDSGIQSKQQWIKLNSVLGIRPVIGSESLQDLTVLKLAKKGLLSLDFQQGKFLGKSEIWQQSEWWPETVIAMNLDNVGGQMGPDISLLRTILKKRADVEVVVAGGVRTVHDLQKLAQENTQSVLVASALHNGSLSAEVLRGFQ